MLLLGATLLPAPAVAAPEDEVFSLVEGVWAVREGGPGAIARRLGAGPYRTRSTLNDLFDDLAADLPEDLPFSVLEIRYRKTGGAGLVSLVARPGRGPGPRVVRARYGEGTWWNVRPEHTESALAYERPGGWVSFGFARETQTFVGASVEWRLR